MNTQKTFHAIGALIGITLASGLPAAAQVSYDLNFSTTNQNMWGTGSAQTLDYSTQFGPSWNVSGSVGGVSSHWYGDYGIGMSGSTSGQVGLTANLHADTGSVNINYPINVQLTYTDPKTWKAGDPFHVSSSYTDRPGASLTTASPNGSFSVGGFINAKARADVSVGYGVGTANETIVNTSINQSANFFTLNSQKAFSGSDPTGTFNINGRVPYVQTSGGYVGNALVSTGSDKFLTLSGDITNGITAALGLPHLLNDSGSWGPFEAGYSILDAQVNATFQANQSFKFTPTPMMQLIGSNGQTFLVPIGSGVDFTLPGDIDSFSVQPNFIMEDVFSSTTWLDLTPSLDFTPLTAYAGAFGYNINFDPFGTYSWSPGTYDLGTVYSNSWQLGGFQNISGTTLSWQLPTTTPEPTAFAMGLSAVLVGGGFFVRRRKR